MSFVVRIDDMGLLLEKWNELLMDAGKTHENTQNQQVINDIGLEKWQRIKWFYYCDNQNGNTIRVYDTEHMASYGRTKQNGDLFYLETITRSKEHYERVICRGKNMWQGEEANPENQQSLRIQFRRRSPWKMYAATGCPLRGGFRPLPDGVHFLREGCVYRNIESPPNRDVRMQYFEAMNQLPSFDLDLDLDLPQILPPFPENNGRVIKMRGAIMEAKRSLHDAIANAKVREWAEKNWEVDEEGFITSRFACWLYCCIPANPTIGPWFDTELCSDTHDVSLRAFDQNVGIEKAKLLREEHGNGPLRNLLPPLTEEGN